MRGRVLSDTGAAIRARLQQYLEPLEVGGGLATPASLLGAYLAVSSPNYRFSGRAFDTYGACESNPDVITASDLVAVTLLSMTLGSGRSAISPEAAISLERHRTELSGLLARIDSSLELHELDEDAFEGLLVGSEAPGRRLFDRLHEILRAGGDRRVVATHKLIARKRPRLLPIQDSVALSALKPYGNKRWWRPWWEALRGHDDSAEAADLVLRVKKIRDEVGATHLSVLRTFDILIWMRHVGASSLPPNVLRCAGS